MPRASHLPTLFAALLFTAAAACSDDPGTSTSPLDTGGDPTADAAGDPSAEPDTSPEMGTLDVEDGGDLVADTAADEGADSGAEDTAADETADAPPEDAGLPTFTTCTDTPFVFTPTGEWENGVATPLIAWQDPGHSIEDRIATLPWDTFQIEGKFAYGVFGNDLQGEWVRAWIDTCTAWEALGRAQTDSDGRAQFDVPRDLLPGPGRYALHMAVEVDATEAAGYLLVVPPSTQFVVFDIDGTLTTSDTELISQFFSDLFGGDVVPEAYEGALDVVNAYREAGYEILYLTGRPYWLDRITRAWLDDEGFPLGTVHFTTTFDEALPIDAGVGDYKLAWLEGILADHTILRAYGNATTDIYAYAEAGIPLTETYIIGDNAGADGTQAVSSYPEHLSALTIPEAVQPWAE